MGISDTVYKRTVKKTESETIAEKFLKRCKTRKSLRLHGQIHRLREAMISVTESHRSRREIHNLCIGHHCLYVSLRKCYEFDFNEPEIITEILSEIFLCEGNLQAIFSILLPGHVFRSNVNINIHTLYPGFSTRIMRKPSTEAFSCYLHYVCEANTRVNKFGKQKQIINSHFDNEESFTPLSAACMRRDPSLILLLLRYGADAYNCGGGENYSTDSIDILVSGLNSIHNFTNSAVKKDTKEALVEEATKGNLCIRYIFRSVRNIPFSQSIHILTEFDEEEEKMKNKTYNLHPRLAATMDTKKFSGMRSLQHVCRLTIRRQIQKYSDRCIPSSISTLTLPKTLHQYLDLQYD